MRRLDATEQSCAEHEGERYEQQDGPDQCLLDARRDRGRAIGERRNELPAVVEQMVDAPVQRAEERERRLGVGRRCEQAGVQL